MSLWIGPLIALNFGCATPSFNFDQQAIAFGFPSQPYQGSGFVHQTYFNLKPLNEFLHIYLGGDGTPWETVNRIAPDPTPRNTIMLRMMALDPTASVYLGRPCYHGFAKSSGCHPKWWTSARYSEEVLASLAIVLTKIWEQHERRKILLFGYSGGGTLAWLLAERLPFVQAVVTVSANLDVEAWTQYHSFSSLTESLNPASRPPLRNHLTQIHFLGKQDTVVPPHLVEKTLQRQGINSEVVIKDVDHQCCWEALWVSMLRYANQAINAKRL